MAELEARGAELWEILAVVAGSATKQMYDEGDVDAGVIACSQSIGIVNEIKSVAKVIGGMVQEAAAIRDRW